LRGTRVVFQAGAIGEIEPGVVRALVEAALATDPLPREVTVSMLGRGPTAAACVVVVPGGLGIEDALARALGSRLHLVESSPDVTWAEVPALVT
jgi:hypothetical protein